MAPIRSNKLKDGAAFLLLTALNLSICWRLFKVEYTDHFSSIEGAFIAIARYLSRHWGDASWWPLWHCGMPYQDTYVPLLHALVAAVASLGHISAARAYHGVTGVTYALGAATLYLLAARLGAPRPAAFLTGLAYSLFSPSAFLMPGVAGDIGGFWYARRLQVLTVYGEGPHISAMTLLPVVLVALQAALTRKTPRTYASAAVIVALVFLTNVPGTMATGLAVFCWICAQPWRAQPSAWRIAAGAAVLAYCLACFGIPPSSLHTVGGNIGSMHPGFSSSLRYGPVPLVLVLAAIAGAGYLLGRTRMPLVIRFAILFFALIAPLAITAKFETFELLPQVGRLHLEMEMAVCILLGCAGWAVYRALPRWIHPIILVLCLAPFIVQFRHYRMRARSDIQYAKLEEHSEFTTARWLDRNLSGERVYVTGSTSFWLNAFTDTPQLIGCCDQGQSMPVLDAIPYAVNPAGSPRQTQMAAVWLKALGVRALVVNGPASTDEYKDIHSPERFAAWPLLHEENGDSIYAVLPHGASLAHVLRPGEQAPAGAPGNLALAAIEKYAAAISADSAPATFQWLRGGVARIRAHLRPGDLLSIQVAWFPGWRAEVRGRRTGVAHDGLGFILLQPRCEGDCDVLLSWTGPRDLPLARLVSLLALALILAVFCTGKFPAAFRFQRTIIK